MKQDREDTGVELYGVQQQLARQQMLIEKEQDNHSIVSHQRQQKEETLREVKSVYRTLEDNMKKDRAQCKETR